jgi:predicted metalloendopeptidase
MDDIQSIKSVEDAFEVMMSLRRKGMSNAFFDLDASADFMNSSHSLGTFGQGGV